MFTDEPAPEPCARIAAAKPAQAVLGRRHLPQPVGDPGDQRPARPGAGGEARGPGRGGRRRAGRRRQGLDEAQQRAAAEAAANEVLTSFQQQIIQLSIDYGQSGLPRLDDPTFVSSVVFDPANPGQPKPRFSIFWPSAEAAQILVRLKPDLSTSERSEAIDLIRDAVGDPAFRLHGAEYVVSGAPVVVDGLSEELTDAIVVLLIAALVVMTLTLALVFGPPARLLPLGSRWSRRRSPSACSPPSAAR